MWDLLCNVDNKDGDQLLDSGPGNNWIVKGDRQQGYFGMVSARDFIHMPEIMKYLDAGEINTTVELTWMKVAHKGKFLFFPSGGLKWKLTWNDIYKAGLVYGEYGPGKYPPVSGPVDQMRVISCAAYGKEWFFKIRLMRGYPQDPFTLGQTTTGSEWDDLMYRMVNDNPSLPFNGDYQTWPSFYLVTYGASLTMESRVDNTAECAGRGLLSNMAAGDSIGKDVSLTGTYNHMRWLPVLEMVNPDDVVFEPFDLYGASEDWLKPPVIVKGTTPEGPYAPSFSEGKFDVNETLLSMDVDWVYVEPPAHPADVEGKFAVDDTLLKISLT